MREAISRPKVEHLSAPAAEHDVLELQVAVSHAHLGAAVEVLHARGHVNTPGDRLACRVRARLPHLVQQRAAITVLLCKHERLLVRLPEVPALDFWEEVQSSVLARPHAAVAQHHVWMVQRLGDQRLRHENVAPAGWHVDHAHAACWVGRAGDLTLEHLDRDRHTSACWRLWVRPHVHIHRRKTAFAKPPDVHQILHAHVRRLPKMIVHQFVARTAQTRLDSRLARTAERWAVEHARQPPEGF